MFTLFSSYFIIALLVCISERVTLVSTHPPRNSRRFVRSSLRLPLFRDFFFIYYDHYVRAFIRHKTENMHLLKEGKKAADNKTKNVLKAREKVVFFFSLGYPVFVSRVFSHLLYLL